MELNQLIFKVLNPLGVPVEYGWYDENIKDTHITFFQFLEKNEEFCDDEEIQTGHYIQVDIWSKENVENLKKKVKSALKEADFSFQEGQDFFENDTKIYHKAMRFYIAECLD